VITAVEANKPMFDVPTVLDFYTDLGIMNKIIAFGPTKSFTYKYAMWCISIDSCIQSIEVIGCQVSDVSIA